MDSELLRKIEPNDLKRVVELEQKCFGEQLAYTLKQLKYLINKANSCCLAEVDNDLIRGFIIVLYKNGSGVAGIETLNVDPIFQGNGIGRKLLIAAEKEMSSRAIRKVRLEVSTGNIPAIALYEKSGFRKTSILKNYYKNQNFGTNDAFRMIKELTT
ncbi:MAG: GNAT family N-acetyltransferase [Candidatus Thermoplasmatota archaeon]|nr:GNAT family N-acetyltransferase [Candidatus Thermoplasmatota archaeon]